MNTFNTNETPINNDLTPLKERANSILNSIDALLSGLGLTPEDEMLAGEIPVQSPSSWGQPFVPMDVDPTTETSKLPEIDPETGLLIESGISLSKGESSFENRVADVETKVSSAETKATEALNTANQMKSDIEKAMTEARSAKSIAMRALSKVSSSRQSAVERSDAETPSYVTNSGKIQ